MFLWVEWEVKRSPILHRQRFLVKAQGMVHHKFCCKIGWRRNPDVSPVCIHDSAHGGKSKKQPATIFVELGTELKTVIEHLKDYINTYYDVKPDTLKVWEDYD